MRLEALNGNFVQLDIVGYQFGDGRSTSTGVDWDANWLVIRGKAWDGTRHWEFEDPCMTTWEARDFASWLRGLGDSSVATVAEADPEEVTLWLTEPNLTFRLHEHSRGVATLDVFFDAEARPPGVSNDQGERMGHRVRLTMPQAEITEALKIWVKAVRRFPVR